jgi:hypothetical protein
LLKSAPFDLIEECASGERKLWRAVLARAINDLVGAIPTCSGRPEVREEAMLDARRFFIEKPNDVRAICAVAGLPAHVVLRSMRDVIAAGEAIAKVADDAGVDLALDRGKGAAKIVAASCKRELGKLTRAETKLALKYARNLHVCRQINQAARRSA